MASGAVVQLVLGVDMVPTMVVGMLAMSLGTPPRVWDGQHPFPHQGLGHQPDQDMASNKRVLAVLAAESLCVVTPVGTVLEVVMARASLTSLPWGAHPPHSKAVCSWCMVLTLTT